MAHGYLSHFDPELRVYSAGVEIHGLNPRAVAIMAEDGIDISDHTSNHVDEYSDINFDFIITVCDHARESCPVFPSGAKRIHQDFPDPAKVRGSEKEIRAEFENTRNMIKNFCRQFIENLQ